MRFTFAGDEYEGRAGETLAAALVRNGVLGGFRSIYLDRPRGVFSAGEEEPNALVQIGGEPMLRATQVELEDGLVAEPLAGKGRLLARGDAARYETFHAHCDLLVVGGGASGVAAASAGAGRTILVHSGTTCALASEGDLRVLTGTTAVGLYDGNYAVAVERGRRLWHIRAKRVVLATGAIERPLVFPNNDRPGIMLAGAARGYELGSARMVVFTNNDSARDIPGAETIDDRAGRRVVDTIGGELLAGVVLDDGTQSAATCSRSRAAGARPFTSGHSVEGGCATRTGRPHSCPTGSSTGSKSSAGPPASGFPRYSPSGSWRVTRPARSSTSSATRPSPISAARSAPACDRSSTSSGSPPSGPGQTRGRRPA